MFSADAIDLMFEMSVNWKNEKTTDLKNILVITYIDVANKESNVA